MTKELPMVEWHVRGRARGVKPSMWCCLAVAETLAQAELFFQETIKQDWGSSCDRISIWEIPPGNAKNRKNLKEIRLMNISAVELKGQDFPDA